MHTLLNQFILACFFALAIYAGYVATEPEQARLAVIREQPSTATTRFKKVAPPTNAIPSTEEKAGAAPTQSPSDAARLLEARAAPDAANGRIKLNFGVLATK